MEPMIETKLTGSSIFKQGKVRDLYDLGDKFLIVATDRISAFDCILPTGIPEKGEILTKICEFWFKLTNSIAPNHLITTEIPPELQKHSDILAGRSMLVKKTKVLPVECIVRGWLTGSGLKEYNAKGSVCGVQLPQGLLDSSKLNEPIFTPTTKAEEGHDMPITYTELENIVGKETALFLKTKSLEVYKFASEYALKKGVIIADTKFEFGKIDNEIILIDEIFTPDSSRFWEVSNYKPGKSQKSFDKQFVRDYLESLDWDKNPPAPELPLEITKKTREKYLEAYDMLTR